MNGIFSQLRSSGINLSDDSLVSVYTDDFVATLNFCEQSITGGSAQVLIDGNESTAWANHEKIEEKQVIIISFHKHTVYIHDFSIQTLCRPPATLKLEGSHDLLHWSVIYLETTNLDENSAYIFSIQHPGRYQYFRLSQIGKNSKGTGDYRFHLRNIEFSGELSKINNYTHHCEQHISYSIFHFTLIIISSF